MATFHIPESGDSKGCYPLTIARLLGDFPLANVPLRRHQQAALMVVGLTEVSVPDADFSVHPAAWFAQAELATFAADVSYGTMTVTDGIVLLSRKGGGRDLR